MKKATTIRVVLSMLVLLTSVVNAGNVAPLGFVLGKTTYNEALKATPELRNKGVNKFSQGKMLSANGTNWRLNGLKNTTLIFDKQQRLAAVLLKMNKNQFDSIFNHLKSKYNVVSKRIPFVGNKYAKLTVEDIEIEINAPHLSFEMTILYATKLFKKSFNNTQHNEKKEKNKREGSLL